MRVITGVFIIAIAVTGGFDLTLSEATHSEKSQKRNIVAIGSSEVCSHIHTAPGWKSSDRGRSKRQCARVRRDF
jgi:hypothetical protein